MKGAWFRDEPLTEVRLFLFGEDEMLEEVWSVIEEGNESRAVEDGAYGDGQARRQIIAQV